jgi:hypothetical protein
MAAAVATAGCTSVPPSSTETPHEQVVAGATQPQDVLATRRSGLCRVLQAKGEPDAMTLSIAQMDSAARVYFGLLRAETTGAAASQLRSAGPGIAVFPLFEGKAPRDLRDASLALALVAEHRNLLIPGKCGELTEVPGFGVALRRLSPGQPSDPLVIIDLGTLPLLSTEELAIGNQPGVCLARNSEWSSPWHLRLEYAGSGQREFARGAPGWEQRFFSTDDSDVPAGGNAWQMKAMYVDGKPFGLNAWNAKGKPTPELVSVVSDWMRHALSGVQGSAVMSPEAATKRVLVVLESLLQDVACAPPPANGPAGSPGSPNDASGHPWAQMPVAE